MKPSKIKKLCRRFNLACGIAFLGFLLMLTECDGPWAGTYVGFAVLTVGFLFAVRTRYKIHIEGRKTKHEIHL